MTKIARFALALATTFAVGCTTLPKPQAVAPVATTITVETQPAQGMTAEQAQALMRACGDNNWCTYRPGDKAVVVEDNETAR